MIVGDVLEKNKYVFSNKTKIRIVSKDKDQFNKEVLLLLKELKVFNIDLKKLVDRYINHKDRNLILNISIYISENLDLLEELRRVKDLPYKTIIMYSDINKDFLRMWKDYIIFYAILMNELKYKYLKDYLSIEKREFENKKQHLSLIEKKEERNPLFRGIVLRDLKNASIVLTSKGELIKLKNKEKAKLGNELTGRETFRLRHYKKEILIGSLITALIVSIGLFIYNYTYTTLVIRGTSEVKIDNNIFKRVVKASCPTSKGKELIFSTDLSNKKIDYAVKDIIEYMNKNKMIEKNKVVIFINKNKLKKNDLILTEKFVANKKIKVLVNNCGKEEDFSIQLSTKK